MLENLDYKMLFGVSPTIIGYFVLVFSLYFTVFKPSREKFWVCFFMGSLLMSSGAIVGVSMSDSTTNEYGGLMFLSAFVWFVHIIIFGIFTSFVDKYKTLPTTTNVVKLNEDKDDVYIAFYDNRYTDNNSFLYKIVKYSKVETFKNKFYNKQHYKKQRLVYALKSIEECKEFVEKYIETPIIIK